MIRFRLGRFDKRFGRGESSESCRVIIQNNSGRSLDKLIMWHTAGEPDVSDIAPQKAIILADNLPNGESASGRAELTRFSPTDYWTSGVLFQGDGTQYIVCGFTLKPFKEFEVSDGSTITFVINAYSEGTTNQNEITIKYSEGDGGNALLLNPTVVAIANIAEAIIEALDA